MLSLRLTPCPDESQKITISVYRSMDDEKEVKCGEYEATGSIGGDHTYFDRCELVLNDSFDDESVSLFGRYGILRLLPLNQAPDDYAGSVFVSGGKDSVADEPNWLRLSRDDHRHLMFLVRRVPEIRAFITDAHFTRRGCHDVTKSEGNVARHLTRLLQVSTAASPFMVLATAGAQCKTPTGGQTGSVSGNGYSAINQTLVQNQEGGISPGGTSPNGTGYGVTYYGLDLSFQSKTSLANTFQLPQSAINFFSPLLGKTGASAQQAFNSSPTYANPPSTIQQQVYSNVYPVYFAAAAASFNQLAASKNLTTFQFSNMPMQWQTVVASMYFQAASPTPSINQKFMQTQFASQIVNGQYSTAYTNLTNFQSPNVYQNQRAAANAQYLKADGCTN
jgi:hypothetical protein